MKGTEETSRHAGSTRKKVDPVSQNVRVSYISTSKVESEPLPHHPHLLFSRQCYAIISTSFKRPCTVQWHEGLPPMALAPGPPILTSSPLSDIGLFGHC